MEALFPWASDWLSLRDVTRLLLLSGLFTAAALLAFPRNAPTRRALLLAAVTALTVIPVLMSQVGHWSLALDELPTFTLAQGLPSGLVVVWLGVAFGLGLLQFVRVKSDFKQIRGLPDISVDRLDAEVVALARKLAIAPPRLKSGDIACSISMREPTIVLPDDWQAWDEQTLRGVLAHELVHIARKDDAWLLVMRGLTIIYWWMPWLKKLASTYVRVMEESCDDAASELVGHDVDYVGALVKAAVSTRPAPGVSTAMHAHHLVGRVGRFTDRRFVELDTAGVYWCVTTIVLFVGLITSFEPTLKHYVQTMPDRVVYATPSASTGSSAQPSYRPVVYDHLELAAHVVDVDRARVHDPEYEPPVIYPGSAIRKRLEGEVTIRYRVRRDGSVSHAQIEQSTNEALATAALRAVTQTRYAPGYTTGHLIRTRSNTQPHIEVRRIFRFRMESEI